MRQEVELVLPPKQASDSDSYLQLAAEKLGVEPELLVGYKIIRRSIDARSRNIKIKLKLLVFSADDTPLASILAFEYKQVTKKEQVVIVGSGPAGLFAALQLIELGFCPIIVERGKDVRSRRYDIARISKDHLIDENSNYSFGEGGAGTFSDGKLYTRSKKRGSIEKILQVLHFHGANDSILYDAHPHIGTNKLPTVIQNIRNTILDSGGEIRFESKVVDIQIENNVARGVVLENGEEIHANAVVLATGHSARDIYELLHNKGVRIEPKSFAVGVRLEHPQELIDSIQYHSNGRNKYLPPASYSLVEQVDGRGVYSFCMCPGGYIVPAATSPNEIVINGMSPAERNSPFANSGFVVEVQPEDFLESEGPLAGIMFQQQLEKMAFTNGGGGQMAPAQRMHDFVNCKLSPSLPPVSYLPGVVSSPVHFWMPEFITSRLRKAFNVFGERLFGFLTNEAVVVAVESRTSSPVQIPRNPETFEHTQVAGLFPCGEGAGYAGGIVSSAMDGEQCAVLVANKLKNNK